MGQVYFLPFDRHYLKANPCFPTGDSTYIEAWVVTHRKSFRKTSSAG